MQDFLSWVSLDHKEQKPSSILRRGIVPARPAGYAPLLSRSPDRYDSFPLFPTWSPSHGIEMINPRPNLWHHITRGVSRVLAQRTCLPSELKQ